MVSEIPYVFKQGIYVMIWASGNVSVRSQFVSRFQSDPIFIILRHPRWPLQLISSFSNQRELNLIIFIYLKAIKVDTHNDSKHCDAITMFRINLKIL